MNRRSSFVLPVLLVAAASCDEPLPEAPIDEDLALVLTTDTVFVAGGVGVGEQYILSRVGSLGFDGRGNLHVFDRDRYLLATWDDDGELVREFGHVGEGPGEFRVPRHAYMLRDGRVLVLDIGPPTLWVFGPKGRYEKSLRLSPGGGKPVPGENSVYAGGRFVGVDDYWMSRSHPEDVTPLFAFSFAGDSVVSAPYHTAWSPPSSQNSLAMLPTVRIAGFTDGRIAVADSVDYRVKILSNEGELVNVIERPIPPTPMTAIAMETERERRKNETSTREVTQAVQEMGAALGVSLPAISREAAEEVVREYVDGLKDLEFADEIPAIRKIAVDWNDRLWITRSNESGTDGPIDLVEADGGYAGTLLDSRRPDAFGPDGLLAYIDDHELGLQSVVVVRIISITTPDRREHP